MNIDTLRRTDGTFRKANASDIRKCLGAGHVTHLQTERGTMAFRPHRNGFTVDRAPNGIRGQSREFGKGEVARIIRNALVFLNGQVHEYEAGDFVEVYSNQAERDGYVLATQGEQVLVEYEMPGTTSQRITSSLVLMTGAGNELTRVKTIPHKQLSKRWCDLIREQGHAHLWIGAGQRSHTTIPMPH